MKDILFCIISDFPFNQGEPFFENELKSLSSSFDQIFIFSINGKLDEKPTRDVYKNVKIFPLNCERKFMKYIRFGFSLRKKVATNRNLFKKIIDYYVFGRNYQVFSKICEALDFSELNESRITIYSYWLNFGYSALLLKEFCLEKNINVKKVVSRCHGFDVYSEVHFLNYIPFQKHIIENIDCTYCCSENGLNYLKEKYLIKSTKIILARLSTNDYGLNPFVTSDKCVFVTVGSFRKVKRYDLFAQAFVRALKYNNKMVWHAFGAGKYFNRVKRFIHKSGFSENVFFHGNVKNDAIINFYKNNHVDFLVNVSSSEGVPVSIMEASSFGIPTIATSVGGTPEIVTPSSGHLISKDINVVELSKVILELFKTRQDINRSKQARYIWETKYNSKKNLPTFVENLLK